MRWVMLAGFLLAAAAEVFVFIRWPLAGVAIPLTVIMALVLIHLRWLESSQLLLFLALSLFMIDSVVAAQPGSLLISGLLAVSSGLALRARLSWPARFFVPACLVIYQLGLWSLEGGSVSFELLRALSVSSVISIFTYIVIFRGIKWAEGRF